MATVEERLSKVEADVQELRESQVVAGLRAQAYGLSLVQGEVAELRAEFGGFRDETRQQFAGINERFAGVESTLQQILDRLPRD